MKARVGLVLAIALITGCKSNKITGTSQNPDSTQNNANNAAQVNQYLDSLPTWATFSPLLPDEDPAPTGAAATVSYDTVASVTTIDSAGNTTTRTNVPYVCEKTPYSLQKTPQQIVMYDPNAGILYPGAFIQGKSYKSGIGSLLPLKFDKRAPVQVSIPAIKSADNFRTVDTVDEAHIQSAVGAIVGTATDDSAQTSSSIAFHWASYYSESQYALSIDASGHYLGFSASVGVNINTDASQHTVMAEFYEKMFTVVVSPPATPAGWFPSDFTRADLQQQVALGTIGPTNLPVYIGDVVYGRMMMFSLTSTASTDSIQAAINASYNGLFGGGSVSLSAEEKKILQTATIEVASVGGNDAATIAMIRTGDFRAYFTSSPLLSTAAPLSYDFYNLADNTLAQVTETTNYKVTTCSEAAPPDAGQFDFTPEQSFGPPVGIPFETRLVDVNGDGHADLVFNHRDANSNEIAVALGQADGTFAAPGAAVSNPSTPPGGWANYQLVTGDFNGDGQTDLAWTNPSGDTLWLDAAMADGSGGWNFQPNVYSYTGPLNAPSGFDYSGFKAYAGDVDGDGTTDLIFSKHDSASQTFVMVPNSTGPWSGGVYQQFNEGVGGYRTFIADVNRDGKADMIWNTPINGANQNQNWTFIVFDSTCSGAPCFESYRGAYQDTYVGTWWKSYQTLVADVNGDQVPDLVWYNETTNPDSAFLFVGLGTTSGPLTFLPRQYLGGADKVGPPPDTAITGDVDGDGRADVILNSLTSTMNTVAVLRGAQNGMSSTVSPIQVDPVSTNWNAALPAMVGDVNGDHDADVVWVIPGSTTQVFVALSRGNATGS